MDESYLMFRQLDNIYTIYITRSIETDDENLTAKMDNYYDVLDSSPKDPSDAIKQRYQQLVLQLHPDKLQQQGLKDQAVIESMVSKYHSVQKAWEVLGDESLRKEYDARWNQRTVAQQWPIQEEVCFEDFDEDGDKLYAYQCRCGGHYKLSATDVSFKVDIVCCTFCSLCIKISYDETCNLDSDRRTENT